MALGAPTRRRWPRAWPGETIRSRRRYKPRRWHRRRSEMGCATWARGRLVVVAFAAAAVVLLALVADLLSPRFRKWRLRSGTSRTLREQEAVVQDPGRERRAEHKARALLRSCVNEEEWAMYRDLGFIRVRGSGAGRLHPRRSAPESAYLLSPHLPIVAF